MPSQTRGALAAAQRPKGVLDIDFDERPGAPPVGDQLKEALRKSAGKVQKLFESWDTDGDGAVSRPEFHRAMRSLGLEVSDLVIDELFSSWQVKEDGDSSTDDLSLSELTRILRRPPLLEQVRVALRSHMRKQGHATLRDAILAADTDAGGEAPRGEGDETLSLEEFSDWVQELPGNELSELQIKQVFASADADGEGSISIDELERLLFPGVYRRREREKALEEKRRLEKLHREVPMMKGERDAARIALLGEIAPRLDLRVKHELLAAAPAPASDESFRKSAAAPKCFRMSRGGAAAAPASTAADPAADYADAPRTPPPPSLTHQPSGISRPFPVKGPPALVSGAAGAEVEWHTPPARGRDKSMLRQELVNRELVSATLELRAQAKFDDAGFGAAPAKETPALSEQWDPPWWLTKGKLGRINFRRDETVVVAPTYHKRLSPPRDRRSPRFVEQERSESMLRSSSSLSLLRGGASFAGAAPTPLQHAHHHLAPPAMRHHHHHGGARARPESAPSLSVEFSTIHALEQPPPQLHLQRAVSAASMRRPRRPASAVIDRRPLYDQYHCRMIR